MSFYLLLRTYQDGLPGAAERDAIAGVLRPILAEPDETGWAELYAGDGGHARIDLSSFSELEEFTEAAVTIELLTPGLSDLIHRVATAGNMTIISAELGDTILLTNGDQAAHLPESEPWWDPHTCVDGGELHWRLTRATGPSPAGPPAKRELSRGEALRSFFGLIRHD